MIDGRDRGPEIESFNLADLDVAALPVRLELSSLIPLCVFKDCLGYCSFDCGNYCHIHCEINTGCNSD